MKKIPDGDPRSAYKSSNITVSRDELMGFIAARHRWVLATIRADGRPQMSLVTGGATAHGQLAIATYPERAKTKNIRTNPQVSVVVMGDEFNDQWVQIDGTAQVLDMPAAGPGFEDYYRSISGEHPDWAQYRQAMVDQGKSLILIDLERWGPISKGGFPPSLFED